MRTNRPDRLLVKKWEIKSLHIRESVFTFFSYKEILFMKNKVIWLAPISMLLLSILPRPQGFYTLLRIIVSLSSCSLTYLEYSRSNYLSLFAILMICLAILFNPLIPIYFSKPIWMRLDVVATFIIGLHLFFKLKNKCLLLNTEE